MKKVLFLPLMQMQSGHHKVADALMDILKKYTTDLRLKKIDLLSYTNEMLEKMVTGSYLKWIRYAPESYNLVYKNFFYAPPTKEHTLKWHQHIFIKKMEQLLEEEKPDLIICTHGFPSYLLSQLKMKGKCNVPIINVYTDFFINSIWGKEGIDFHFVPSKQIKETLRKQVSEQNMIVTGIPVHEEITQNVSSPFRRKRLRLLISGGNSGLGGILRLADELKQSTQFDFFVLCGNNRHLYNEILSWQMDHIKPLPYISSRSEMNKLYDKVDAIVTKPGGVTISEALRKRLPIFVHSSLPGQEEINLKYLKQQELVFELSPKKSLQTQLLRILKDKEKMKLWNKAIDSYHAGIEIGEPGEIAEIIKSFLYEKEAISLPSKVYGGSRRAASLLDSAVKSGMLNY